ncbi:MAG TPA: hypothetical protein VK633_00155 [Verrucomicrobiae bacterium]|nr:hypothetical protein [Verrucomicrobiae bacterium]
MCATLHSFGGTFTNDFNSGTNAPPGTALYGNAVIEAVGGVGNSGTLKLTKAVGGQSSSFILDDLDAGAPIYGFDMAFKARIDGGGTPADGFSVNFAPDLPQSGFGEVGAGNGITFVFDIYINNPPETSRSIQVKVGGAVVASRNMTLEEITTGANFEDVHIQLNPDGMLNLTYKGLPIFTNFFLPNYQPLQGQFGFGARTGGAFANQFIDNLSISTFLQPRTGISQQPLSLTVRQGSAANLSVQITNPEGAAFQWLRNGTNIPGATTSSLTISNVTAADTGAKFKVLVTGANNNVTSEEVALTVVDIPVPTTPKLSFNFNDGTTPPNTTLISGVSGGGTITTTGGVGDSGVLHLTDAANDQRGAFIVADADAGVPVYGFTARFDALVGGGGATPADGFSFNFASNIPEDPTTTGGDLENGVGTGLSVGFDIYDNGGGEAPSVDVRYNGQVVSSQKVPLAFIETDTAFEPVIIRLEPDGTLDVVYGGTVLMSNLSIPGFSSISGGQFALVGRTGGANENQWFDNIEITTVLTPGDLRITTQPANRIVAAGGATSFSVSLNDTNGVTYQWFKGGTAIAGATSSTLAVPTTALTDNGGSYTVQVKKGNLSVTSDPATLTVVDVTTPTASFNFDNGQTPAGTHLFFTPVDSVSAGYISTTGGVNGSGVLHLTDAAGGQAGAFVIDPLLGGAELSGFSASFDLLLGGGGTTPADGMSFNFASDLPSATAGAAEEGVGTGLSINFDIYINEAEPTPPRSIDVKYKGAYVATVPLALEQIDTGETFRQVVLRVTPDGKLDLAFGDRVLFSGLQLTNYTFTSNGKFGFYARTGGANENQWVDNIRLQVTKSTAPLRIVQEPADVLLLPGQTATFTTAVSDPNGVTYEWTRNGAVIAGATGASYTTPALTDAGAKYMVRVTGPGGTVTSREAIANVVAPLSISNPKVSFDFEAGQPAEVTLNGTAIVTSTTGTNGSAIELTMAAAGQGGALTIADFNNGQAVSAFTAHFQMHVANGSGTPADGFAFIWADDIDATANFGEGGAGSGLVVSFDTYQNPGEAAPAIQVTYKGTVITRKLVPYSLLATGDAFADVYIRVEADGTLDLQYKNTAIFSNLQLPNFTPMAAGIFGLGARTGGEFEEHWVDNIQIATSTGAAAPQVTIAKSATGVITINWTGGGVLQARDDLNAATPWTPVTAATSPYTVTNDRRMRFFRVAQ